MSIAEGIEWVRSSAGLEALSHWLLMPFLALLRQPIVLGELGFLFAILVLAFLHEMGAPLQFFHEDARPQRRAGFASTLTVAHLFFVLYLVEASNGLGVTPTLAWFLGFWSLTVALGVRTCLKAAHGETADAPPLVPRLKSVVPAPRSDGSEGLGLGPNAVVAVSPWPFVHGVLLGLLVATAVLAVSVSVVDRLDALFDPLWKVLESYRVGAPGMVEATRPGLHLLALLAFALLVQLGFFRKHLGAAGSLCLLLAFVASIVGATRFWLNGQLVIVVPALVLAWFAGRQLYALRVPDLADVYARPKQPVYPPAASAEDPEPLLADQLVSATAEPASWPDDGLPARRPLIIVCASGGGLRAATWTAGVLARLEERVPHFARLTLLVTGASGGMVGSAHWVAALRSVTQGKPRRTWRELMTRVNRDGLTGVLQTMMLNDVPRAFSSVPNLDDRGTVLQASWTKPDDALDLTVPLVELKAGERERLWPSLIFSPMIVEDGRRLLLGNLRLKSVVESRAPWINVVGRTGPTVGLASISAFHAADLFATSAARLTLGTAARLSAAFPYVSPAVVLPTEPRTRVVDAGYYDNFGLDLGTSFLREALEHQSAWLARHVSRILVIRVEDEPSDLTGTADDGEAPASLSADQQGFGARLARVFEGLTSPMEGMLSARNSVMRLRNDAAFEAVFRAYEQALGREFVLAQVFQLKGKVALSWYLTRSELRTMEGQLVSDGIEQKLDDVASWVRAGL